MVADLRGAWAAMKRDPVGILLPAAGALLVELVAVLLVRHRLQQVGWPWDDPVGWRSLAAFAVGVLLARFVLTTPLRAELIAAGARALGRPARGWRRTLALLGVQVLVGLIETAALVVIGGASLAASTALVSRRGYTSGLVVLAAGAVAAWLAILVIRALFAFAPAQAVLAGQGGWAAVRDGAAAARGHRLQLAALLLTGDGALSIGGLLCGAGALPGYPIGDLAVLHRWIAREGP